MRDTSKYKGPRGRLGNAFVGETPRDRRNNKRFLAMCALWAICFIAVDVIQEKTSLSSTLAWILAVLPALPGMVTSLIGQLGESRAGAVTWSFMLLAYAVKLRHARKKYDI